MEQELERLVEVGDLYRLFYKGSPSFRIVPPEAKAKRRQVSQKPAAAEASLDLTTQIDFCPIQDDLNLQLDFGQDHEDKDVHLDFGETNFEIQSRKPEKKKAIPKVAVDNMKIKVEAEFILPD